MNKHLLSGFCVLAAILPLACGGGEKSEAPAPQASAPAAPVGNPGGIKGTVTFNGASPDTAIKMDADPVCKTLHKEPVMTEKVVKDAQGHLGNVFVYVKEGLQAGQKWPVPAQTAQINQQGCQYHPHVQGVMVGQKVEIINSDPTLHNIHAHPTANQEFNQGQPMQNMKMEKVFDKVEVMMPFRCDVHPWMAAYMGVLDHPFFATSKADGSFDISKLPAGTYTLTAWHETLGTQEQKVTVEAGKTAEVSFSFKG